MMFKSLIAVCVIHSICYSKEVKDRGFRLKRESSELDTGVDDIMHVLQGTCPTTTMEDLRKNTQAALKNIAEYREVVKMNNQLRAEIKRILEETKGRKEVARIVDFIKHDVRGECLIKAKDCTEIYKTINKKSGVYTIYLGSKDVEAYCDMTTEEGGWTVIQRHTNADSNFQQNWNAYKTGFGDLKDNFWFGNEYIHQLTSSGTYKLRIVLVDKDNKETYADYSTFVVGDEASQYKLTVGGYNGTAGDSMTYHNGLKFFAKDKSDPNSCTSLYGPWWFNVCAHAALNGNGKTVWNAGQRDFMKSTMMLRKI